METVLRYLEQVPWMELAVPAGRVLLMLVVVWILLRVLGAALDHFERRLIHRGEASGAVQAEAEKRADTLVQLLRKGVVIVVWLVVGLMILRELGMEIGPILASAGILGLAVGFGAQNLVRDVISGFFLIMENQIRVGDVVSLNGISGTVEKVDFRITVLRDLHGTVHVLPNGTITELSNMTQEWSASLLDIRVAYKEDTDRVIEIMQRIAAELRADEYFGPAIREELEVFGVNEFGESGVVVRVRLQTEPGQQWEVGREFRRRLKPAFEAEGIEIPVPHRTLYAGKASEPMRVEVVQDLQGSTEQAKQPE